MRTIIQKINIYKFTELSKQAQERVINDFHTDGYFNYILEEMIDSLKSLKDKTFGQLNYSLSCHIDRGEFIKFTDYDDKILQDLIKDKGNCPLTGCCYDISLLESIEKGNIEKFIDIIHKEYGYFLSHNSIKDCCEANEYEFTVDGEYFITKSK